MSNVNTVKKLREYLDKMEAGWTKKDTMYLGDFEDQQVYIPYFSKEGKFLGYGDAYIDYTMAAWFVLDEPKEVL